jgi:membrane protease YdiL (CAAX protease family)
LGEGEREIRAPMPPLASSRRWAVIFSPIGVIALGFAVQRLAGLAMGAWAWIPTMLVFWCAVASLIRWGSRGNPARLWLRRPTGSGLWSVLALGVGLVSVRELVLGWHVLRSPTLVALWLGFGLLNPWLEEGYWRGLLIDATRDWPWGLGVAYSTALFALSHPLIWGVHSAALRHPAVLVGLGLAGGVWGMAYWRTGSLRWTIAGHACANLFGLSVPVLLNLHVPGGLR